MPHDRLSAQERLIAWLIALPPEVDPAEAAGGALAREPDAAMRALLDEVRRYPLLAATAPRAGRRRRREVVYA